MKTCSLVVDMETQLIKDILINKNPDFAARTIEYIINNLKANKVNKEVLVFHERLKKPINDYSKKTAHVSAALKLINQGFNVNVGDVIPYYIATGPGSISQRAEPFFYEYNLEIDFPPDVDYYITKQLQPMRDNLFKATGVVESEEGWYYYYLKTFHWLVLKYQILDYADHKCQVCSSQENLEVHHNTYERLWMERPSDLVALCSTHHELFHLQGGIQWQDERSSPLSA